MKKETLLSLIQSDKFGLLKKTKHKKSAPSTAKELLIAQFQEINDFYRIHGYEPNENENNIEEFQLYHSLKTIRENNNHVLLLIEYDEFSLLGLPKPISSIQDIFDNDKFGLLHVDSDAKEIFNLQHVSKKINLPDYVAQRIPCQDFDIFQHFFQKCHEDLKSGKRQLRLFKYDRHQNIDKKQFFILRGVLLYVADVNIDKNISDHDNPRLRCIFENGTEADLLKQSLITGLYQDGRIVTKHKDELLADFKNPRYSISNDDEQTGCIYILKSLSQNPLIQKIKDLYKVGFSKSSMEQRIKNAEHDPTYLQAPVKIISIYAGLITYPSRGMMTVTQEGKSVLIENPSHINRKYLTKYPAFNTFINKKTASQKQIDDISSSHDTPTEILKKSYEDTKNKVQSEIHDLIMNSSPKFFEKLVVNLIVKMGYGGSVAEAGQRIGKSGDGGIDGVIKQDQLGLEKIYLQAKRWIDVVGRPEIQKFVGVVELKNSDKGIFITTSKFSQEAHKCINTSGKKIVLIDGEKLLDLMWEYNLALSIEEKFEIKRINNDYFDEINDL